MIIPLKRSVVIVSFVLLVVRKSTWSGTARVSREGPANSKQGLHANRHVKHQTTAQYGITHGKGCGKAEPTRKLYTVARCCEDPLQEWLGRMRVVLMMCCPGDGVHILHVCSPTQDPQSAIFSGKNSSSQIMSGVELGDRFRFDGFRVYPVGLLLRFGVCETQVVLFEVGCPHQLLLQAGATHSVF